MSQRLVYTVGDLQRLTGATRHCLTQWTRAGLLIPGVRLAQGTGSRQLFDWADLCSCYLLAELHEWAIKPSQMRYILDLIDRVQPWPTPPPVPRTPNQDLFLLVESIRDQEMRFVRASSFLEAVKSKPKILGVNLSALQRNLWKRLQRLASAGKTNEALAAFR